MRLKRLVVSGSLCAILLLMSSGPSAGQEHEPDPDSATAEHEATEHEFHRNHFGGMIAVTTHHNTGDSGITLGLEYARVLSPKWAVAAYLELVSSDLERDLVFVAGGIFYPVRGVSLQLGAGVEQAEESVEAHGKVETETELALLIRMGAGYTFQLTPTAGLGPFLFVDWAGDRLSSVVAIGMAVGF